LAQQTRLQEDMKKVKRGRFSAWLFILVGFVLVGFGYAFYESKLSYSGIFLAFMGITSIVFGFVLARYSREIA